ncbi:MAG: hypothetical protein KH347_06265 [Acetobacter sp.]|nr:hypothetical protein [Acetobacter sp.]
MTVSSQTNKIIYIGNGVAKEFAIPFSFLEQQHIKVEQKQGSVQTERTDWTVKNGNLVFAIAPESGAEIAIVREVPLTQETDYRDNEILHAETLERNFDKLTMQVQQLAEKSARAVTVDIFDDTAADSLIPSIRKAVSDCQTAVETTTANITAAAEQVQTATAQATAAATSATNAATSETNTAAMLGTKADVDLSNLTEKGKEQVVTLLIPDYAAGVDITSTNGSYTAPANGRVYFSIYGGMGGQIYDITIDGITVFDSRVVSSGEYRNIFFYDVRKDSVICWKAAAGLSKTVFYPF